LSRRCRRLRSSRCVSASCWFVAGLPAGLQRRAKQHRRCLHPC
jgi:hypothetical protein